MPRKLTKVGKYTIDELIARGGMGAVYRAKHPTLKRNVILKQLTLRGGGGFIERFKREASLMIDLRDERIVTVYDHFREGSSYYIVMEYVEGTSLDRLLAERGRLSNEAALLVFTEVCRGLKHAHDRGVIHRDIKPGNILISNRGEVKLTDFGIATSKEAGEEGLTQTGMTLGTPSYMSPEQISEAKKVDKRADIYSLGVMLYEMLTGTKPFPPDLTPDTVNRINRGQYRKPRRIDPSIPPVFSRIIRKAMHHKPGRRFQDLQQVLDRLERFTRRYGNREEIRRDLRRYLREEQISLPGARGRRRRMKSGRRALRAALGTALAVVLAAGGLYAWYSGACYELFGSRTHGRLGVVVTFPEGYYRNPALIAGTVTLTPGAADDAGGRGAPEGEAGTGGGGSPAAGAPRTYRLAHRESLLLAALLPAALRQGSGEWGRNGEAGGGGDGEQDARSELATRPIYLPAGSWDLELNLQGSKLYASVTLQPRVVQRQDLRTHRGKIVRLDLQKAAPRLLDIEHRVQDSVTGESLYREADIDLYVQGTGWVDWKQRRSDPRISRRLDSLVTSGKTYRFRYRASHYYQREVSFFAEPELDTVRLQVSLVRMPGILVIQSNRGGLRILINNREQGYLGGERRSLESYGETVEGEREFTLPAGSHVLTVSRNRRQAGSYQLTVRPQQVTRVRVLYDQEEGAIRITGGGGN